MQHQPKPDAPLDDLYIYYVKGRVKPASGEFGPRFIGSWEEGGSSFLFFSEPVDEKINALLDRRADLTMLDRFYMRYADWHGGPIEPLYVGDFVIVPPWMQETADDDGRSIILDPGVVFGAGNHPTTRDCLTALEMVFNRGPVNAVLDLGTGTGVLSLAAARLGCPRVLAVDFNHLAARTTWENIQRNQMARQVLSICGRAEDFTDYPADLLIANIHYDVMRHLIEAPGFVRKKWFILSGLLRSEARHVEDQLLRGPGTITKKWTTDGIWHTFLGTFPNA